MKKEGEEMRSQLTIEATIGNLPEVLQFVNTKLEENGIECDKMTQMRLEVAVEEIFVNIASYAYTPETGMAEIWVDLPQEGEQIHITFIDSGVPYNPLEKPDPALDVPASERQIGGLGIYMVKKSMDGMDYAYQDGKNILSITKKLRS